MSYETEVQLPRRLNCCVDVVKASLTLLSIVNVEEFRLLGSNVV
jgi:hypothetical protein